MAADDAATPESPSRHAAASATAPATQRKQPLREEDSDLDPAAFLKSVRELSERREFEDRERIRKLEEEVAKGRQERAARRAERARSISPKKRPISISSPPNRASTISRAATNASTLASPSPASRPVTMTPPSSSGTVDVEPEKTAKLDADVPEFKGFGSIKRSSTTAASNRSSTSSIYSAAPASNPAGSPIQSATGLARSGTLTWNRRPQSQLGGPRPPSQVGPSRPQSQIGGSRPHSQIGGSRPESVASPAAAWSRDASPDKSEPSRDQIAASLEARDPSRFKQTADRGIGSAAYRKSKDEAQMGDSPIFGRRGLPGMSRDALIESNSHNSPPSSASIKSDAISRGGSVRGSIISAGSRFSTTSTSSKPDLKALIAEDESQQQAAGSGSLSFDQTSFGSTESSGIARTLTMSSSQARLANATDRPSSPTKGMGGFVQSAMMKRTDSQNKRWSAQPGNSFGRSDSMASNRGSLGMLQGSYSMPKLEPSADLPDPAVAKESTSRPTSSSIDLAKLVTTNLDKNSFAKPSLPSHSHSRSKSVASNYSTNDDLLHSPGSPSKRFSPTKSSWLESSLTRPESPTKMTPAKNSQPSWMADLASRKAQRGSADVTPFAGTPRAGDGESSRPSSPTKESTPFGQVMLKRAESRDFPKSPTSAIPGNNLQSLRHADKFEASPAAALQTSKDGIEKTPELPQEMQPRSHPIVQESKFEAVEQDKAVSDLAPSSDQVSAMPPPEAQKSTSPLLDGRPKTPGTLGGQWSRDRAKSIKSPSIPFPEISNKPDALPKPVDFRSQLKSRPPPGDKPTEQPEFMSKFGALRKTQQEKFVAPDVLKANILRGKSGLNQTDGPVKSIRKDELKDSLLAKKDDWKKAKDEGRDLPGAAHERKISETVSGHPTAPAKPEALAKREMLARSESARGVPATERAREGTPEALARHKTMRSKPTNDLSEESSASSTKPVDLLQSAQPSKQTSRPIPKTAEPALEPLSRQTSAPLVAEPAPLKETSKMASRFNPGLAGLLARGPPSQPSSRSGTPSSSAQPFPSPSTEPVAPGAPLVDVRKDRAKGPKRRKAGAAATTELASPAQALAGEPAAPQSAKDATQPELPVAVPKPAWKAGPSAGSVASVMSAHLNKASRPISTSSQAKDEARQPSTPATPSKHQVESPPLSTASFECSHPPAGAGSTGITGTIAKSSTAEAISSTPPALGQAKEAPAVAASVPEFKGFGSSRAQKVAQDENKENDGSPSVKAAASIFGRRPIPQKTEPPPQIKLPTKSDQDAAMRSAGLLSGSPRTSPQQGLGISLDKQKALSPSNAPPKPSKSSRTVSGQLAEASPNKDDSLTLEPATDAGRLLVHTFAMIPKYGETLALDTSAIVSERATVAGAEYVKTRKRSIQVVFPDGSIKALSPQHEYTFFDESVFLCTHTFEDTRGTRSTQIYVWAGQTAFETTTEAANNIAIRLSREYGSATIQNVKQGHEPETLLQALGGILITRRGAAETAPRQFMLCGRKHLGRIVFDEVDFAMDSLCSGFAYLVSYPLTLVQTRLYVWKGSACCTEEHSAAKMAAMDLSENGDFIPIDGGAEFPSFLKMFGPNTQKSNITPSGLWSQKMAAPSKFCTRLYRIQQAPQRTGLINALWSRRPSWSISARSSPSPEGPKVEVKEIAPILQSSLEAEGIYLLDGFGEIHLLLGPLFSAHPDPVRNALLGQALLFASNYAIIAASTEDRPTIPKTWVVFSGVPGDVKFLFRHWDDSRGLWGTAGLMAGKAGGERGVEALPLTDVLNEVCRD